MKSRDLCAALGLCALLAGPPQAIAAANTPCTATVRTDDRTLNPGYATCLKANPGTLNGVDALTRLHDFLASPYDSLQWSLVGLSTDPGFGPFSASPATLRTGSFTLDTARADLFVIGMQATISSVTEDVFYLFDYRSRTATNTIAFDTLGFLDSQSSGPPLQVAGLYVPAGTNPPPAGGGVPEPAAWALMVAGLGALGAVGRRRVPPEGTAGGAAAPPWRSPQQRLG